MALIACPVAAIGTDTKHRIAAARAAFRWSAGGKNQALGGIRWMFLTHCDDVADHAKFRRRSGAKWILHSADLDSQTRDVERKLGGAEAIGWMTTSSSFRFRPHAGVHMPALSGDHAWWDGRRNRVHASKALCWYDWKKQTASMERLRCRLPKKEWPPSWRPS